MSQPVFVGTEASANPAVEDLLRVAQALVADGAGEGYLSVRHGLRATTSSSPALEALGPRDFVEVADYDPHRDQVMVLGPSPPHPHAGLHFLVLRAKRELGAVVQVLAPGHHALARLPQAQRGRTTLDLAMSVLEKLRASEAVAFGTGHVLAVGRTLDEAHAALAKALEAPA